jgi:hypothetical protein
MHPAARLQFQRAMDEFVQWRAIAEDERPPAPAWWWGPAFELRDMEERLPLHWCGPLRLPQGATYAAAAKVLRDAMAGETLVPWPYDFSSKVKSTDSDVRDLHVQPSDDSAFPP